MQRLKGVFFILTACLFCSTAGTFQALAPEGATPWTVTEMRMTFGAATLLIWCVVTHRLPTTLKGLPFTSLAICVASNIIYQLLFFSSLKVIGVAVGSVIS
ncbi:MAG TPA: EamA family transporter, partial [Sutterella sp.]|nr:EamA family transporter [Sutterella sp.]